MKVRLFGCRFELRQRLQSKKNRVYLAENAGGRFVLKLYRAPHHLNSTLEHRVLQLAHRRGLAVARPLAFIEKRALLMEYIPGENLCDLLNRRYLPEYVDQLACWLAAFHRSFVRPGGKTLTRGDSNLRNFIIHENGALYGVDFEEAAPGNPAWDLGRLCASILDTEPMFTPEKAALCRRLIARYGRAAGRESLEKHLTSFIAAALRETARRRPQQRSFLLKQSNLIMIRGLDYYLDPPAGLTASILSP